MPAEGATICGVRFEAGTVVGMNAWVVHRDKEVFGNDAEEWRPERWLGVDGEKRKRMEAGLLTVCFFFSDFSCSYSPPLRKLLAPYSSHKNPKS